MPYKDAKAQKEAQRQYYLANKKLYIERQRKYRQDKRDWFDEYKKDLSCEECGNNHPAVLDFHHDDPSVKDIGISDAVRAWGIDRLLIEVSKCRVLCSNCHRIHHWNENTADKQ